MYPNVHCSTIYSSHDMEATSISINGGMDKEDVVHGASLVAQWLRICLPMQGTQVRALVWEDPTCRGATGPVSHNY